MLTLYIVPKKVKCFLKESRSVITPLVLQVRTGKGFLNFHRVRNFKNVSRVRICLKRNNGSKRTIKISQYLEIALKGYLLNSHIQKNKNVNIFCYTFACWVSGEVFRNRNEWDISERAYRVVAGSIIFLFGKDNRFKHAAVYLGENLYVSVYG